MERVMEKAVELSSLTHPFYVKTKHFAQEDVMQKIADAIEKYEKLTAS
jgi:ribosomal protein L31